MLDVWLQDIPTFHDTESLKQISDSNVFERVHWSWFLPTLKSYSPKEQALFLAALTPSTAATLKDALHLKTSVETITEPARQYLKEQLLFSVAGPSQSLPAGCFIDSPLNQLLQLHKKQLIRLIDFLSLYDLAAELRQIVETKILKKIYSLLTEEQKSILQHIGSHKEPYTLPRLGLDRWDGTEETLRNSMHKRGLVRLGLALTHASADLIWTICHQLDIGRGTALYKLCEAKPVEASDEIMHQVLELMRYV